MVEGDGAALPASEVDVLLENFNRICGAFSTSSEEKLTAYVYSVRRYKMVLLAQIWMRLSNACGRSRGAPILPSLTGYVVAC